MGWLISQAGDRFRNFKSQLTKDYIRNKVKVIAKPPPKYTFITQEEWDKFVKSRQTDEFKEESAKHSAIVANNEHRFRGSRKGYAGVEEEMVKEIQKKETISQGHSSTKKLTIPRHELWLACRMPKSGIMDEPTKKVADKIELVSQQALRGEIVLSERQDILATALGKKEHPGRVRAAGGGVRITQYFGKAKDGRIDELEAEIALLKREMEKIKTKKDQPVQENDEIQTKNDGSVQDIAFPEGWTYCKLHSQELGNPLVAIGKVFNTSDNKILMIHNKPLQHGNMKVEVVDAKVPEAPLPVPTSEANFVFEAVNSFLEWPRSLIFLEKYTSKDNNKRKRDVADTHSESSNTIGKFQTRKVPNDLVMTAMQKSVYQASSLPVKMMYKIARNMEGTVEIPIAKELSHDGNLWITKEEILQWIYQEQIQATHISVYIGCLLNMFAQDPKIQDRFGYICPERVSEVPINFKEDRQNERDALAYNRMTTQVQYIADQMKGAKKNQIFFAPYNSKRHWMLCIIHPFQEVAYWFDPLGMNVRDEFKSVIEMAMKIWLAHSSLQRANKPLRWIHIKCPRQTNNTDCGYYVLRYMLDIIRKRRDNPLQSFTEILGSEFLSKEKIDEVRDQWVKFVQEFM